MALPHKNISQIPNNEPDAVPALWNLRYDEIDKNFASLDDRQEKAESEISKARGGESSIGDRLAGMSQKLEDLSPEYQAELSAGLMFALGQASVANRSVEALKGHLQQEGEVFIINRGVVSGCAVTRATTSARNLNLTEGVAFMSGRMFAAPGRENAASVPVNTGQSSVTVRAFLYFHEASRGMRLSVTPIGEDVPEYGIHIYNITIPGNSTDETDPGLEYVSITNVRRMEPDFPSNMQSPQIHSVSINDLSDSDYRLDIDLVSSVGEPCRSEQVQVLSRATNGFTMRAVTSSDNIILRWRVSKLNN